MTQGYTITAQNHLSAEERLAWERLRPGEAIQLRREPTNQYDPNAVLVLNAEGVKVGYIKKSQNAELAKWLDDGGVGDWRYEKPNLCVTGVPAVLG